MRTKQELRRILDQFDLDHAEQGGFQGAACKLIEEAGPRGMIPEEIVDRLFPDLPAEDRAGLGDMLNRGEDGDDNDGGDDFEVSELKYVELAEKHVKLLQEYVELAEKHVKLLQDLQFRSSPRLG
jgi:hypothetical protein